MIDLVELLSSKAGKFEASGASLWLNCLELFKVHIVLLQAHACSGFKVFSHSCGDLFAQMSLSWDLGSDFTSGTSPWDFLPLSCRYGYRYGCGYGYR